ncbi:MAG: hypothetical protein J6F30_12725 [Cellulosilyticum sp.]|nr:hypothetical protein [Cellulosilyticum sp.]
MDMEVLTGVVRNFDGKFYDIKTNKVVSEDQALARRKYVTEKLQSSLDKKLPNEVTLVGENGRTMKFTPMTKAERAAIERDFAERRKQREASAKTTERYKIDGADVTRKTFDDGSSTSVIRVTPTKQAKSTPITDTLSKSSASTTKKTTTTKSKEATGPYNEFNIPQVGGASKSVMRKTATYMNKGMDFESAFNKALQSAGYGIGTRRGGFM